MTTVSVEHLTLSYASAGSSVPVLDIPHWQLDTGEQVAIRGPSGSGKSTFLNVLAGLLPPSGGAVSVCGEPLASLDEAARDRFRARHIGYVFQTFNLLQGYTAWENVLMGAAFARQRVDKARARTLLERVGLANRLNRYPAQLSIGEQQRVAIARALVKRPELLLADEPTGSLDPRRTRESIALLRDACREEGCALAVVSHEPAVVDAFERRDDFLALNRALGAETGGAR